MKMEVDQSIYYLRITKVLQEDAGNYSCVASNDAEERFSKAAYLKVLGLFSFSIFSPSPSCLFVFNLLYSLLHFAYLLSICLFLFLILYD